MDLGELKRDIDSYNDAIWFSKNIDLRNYVTEAIYNYLEKEKIEFNFNYEEDTITIES